MKTGHGEPGMLARQVEAEVSGSRGARMSSTGSKKTLKVQRKASVSRSPSQAL